MAIPTHIKTLMSGNVVEWDRIKLKKPWNVQASLKTICAFANDINNWGGGYIVIEVKEQDGCPAFPLKGAPPEKINAYQEDLLNKSKMIQPEHLPLGEVLDYKGKTFFVVWVPGGNSRPYSSPKSFAKDSNEQNHHIRKMASTTAPSDTEERDLYNLANSVPFDDRVSREAERADLNITLSQQYLKEIGSSLYQESMTMEYTDLCESMKRNTHISIEGENDGVDDGVFEDLSSREIDILAATRENQKDSAEKIGKAVGVSKSIVEPTQRKRKELKRIRRGGLTRPADG